MVYIFLRNSDRYVSSLTRLNLGPFQGVGWATLLFFLQFFMARWLSVSDPPPSLCWSMSSLLEGQGFCRLPGLRSPCQSLLSAAEPLMPLARKWKKLPNNLQIDANVVTSNSCCSASLFVKTSSCVELSGLKFNSVHLTKMFWAAALYPGLDKALGKWNIQDRGGSFPTW